MWAPSTSFVLFHFWWRNDDHEETTIFSREASNPDLNTKLPNSKNWLTKFKTPHRPSNVSRCWIWLSRTPMSDLKFTIRSGEISWGFLNKANLRANVGNTSMWMFQEIAEYLCESLVQASIQYKTLVFSAKVDAVGQPMSKTGEEQRRGSQDGEFALRPALFAWTGGSPMEAISRKHICNGRWHHFTGLRFSFLMLQI